MLKKLNFRNLDKKTKLYLGIAIGMILFIIFLLIILKLTVKRTIGSKQFEARVKNATQEYYKKYPNKLPDSNNSRITISIDELVNEGFLKNPEKLLKKGLTCKGKVSVSNNNGYYIYQPIIECSDDYKTKLLYQKILEDNPIKTSGNGLYQVNDYYLFRGELVNNFVSFADKKWYILRINNDNTIRLIMIDDFRRDEVWDNRYNSSTKKYTGKNDFMISRIKESLDFYYNDLFDESSKTLIVPKELCIGARSENSVAMDGTIECLKTTPKLPLGLLQTNEYPIISLDPECTKFDNPQCTNYNFLTNLSSFWSLNAVAGNTYQVYEISGIPIAEDTNTKSQARIVLNISSDVLYSSGKGTEDDPYIIK